MTKMPDFKDFADFVASDEFVDDYNQVMDEVTDKAVTLPEIPRFVRETSLQSSLLLLKRYHEWLSQTLSDQD